MTPMGSELKRVAVWLAVAALISTQVVGCSGDSKPGLASKAPSATATGAPATPSVDAASFSGPVIEHCATQTKSTTLSKLNIGTGALVDIATFPVSCNIGNGQIGRALYSRDFHKLALDSITLNDGHVRYYDSDRKSTVDVTEMVQPSSSGDFGNQQRPDHRNPQFDEQGLLVFYDARAKMFDFFDTDAKKVVRTSPTYLPNFLRSVAINPEQMEHGEGELPSGGSLRMCPWLWMIDDTRYLRSVHDDAGHYLVIDAVPPPGVERPTCSETDGQRITPPSTEISEAAADPAGTTIIFTVFSHDDIKVWNMYQANLQDPSHPTQIKMSGNILERAGYDGGQAMSIVGWN
ncbi:hypothetical protein ACNO8X_03105 [Mycobacterium sp. PDNC021]|uniref:hypothetical protein n=1 Tax=Mycobacterium sp. PDNC021 TaxID=3391399 RepID=UPI003AAEE2EA